MKRCKKILAMLLICILVIGTVKVSASACTNAFLGGNVSYNINNLGFQIMSNARNNVLTLSVYQRASWNFANGGWSGITRANGTNMTNIVVTGSGPFGPRTYLPVRGNNSLGVVTGMVTGFNSNGQSVPVNSNWSWAEVTMNTHANAWRNRVLGIPVNTPAATQTLRAEHTFRHEVGHVLKLNHVTTAGCTSVMRTGFPGGNVSATVVNHDRQTLRAKWR